MDIRAWPGYLALLANDLDDAVKHLTHSINLGHRSLRLLSDLADAYYRTGRLGSVAYCYERLDREGLAAAPLPCIEVKINGHKANMVLDIPHSLVNWFPDLPVHGILGTGLFANFTTTLDYYNKKLHLAGPGATVEPRQENHTSELNGFPSAPRYLTLFNQRMPQGKHFDPVLFAL